MQQMSIPNQSEAEKHGMDRRLNLEMERENSHLKQSSAPAQACRTAGGHKKAKFGATRILFVAMVARYVTKVTV
jgi:hypothetical protein